MERPNRIQRVVLSEKNKKLRLVLICILLAIGTVAIGVGLFSALTVEGGWRTIEHTCTQRNCADEFTLQYYFGDDPGAATADNKAITQLYSNAAEKAYQLFSPDEKAEGGLGWLNAHVNEPVEIDPVLYAAFEKLERYGSREVYLAPIYTEYDGLFFSETDASASYYDPDRNPDMGLYFSEVLAFVNDPQAVHVELLGENQACLRVSEEYAAFVQENEIDTLVDFHWMKNAFIVDYFAQLLTEAGYTSGYIASYDGFTRNLDTAGRSYSLNLVDRYENGLYPAGVLEYSGPAALVNLRNYPLSQQDRLHYRSWEDQVVTTSYISTEDGRSRSATDNLVSWSSSLGCGEVLLRISPLYLDDELDTQALAALEEIDSIWAEGTVLHRTDPGMQITSLLQTQEITYTVK